jgi:metallophosphoesterase (TIGR00282 family)
MSENNRQDGGIILIKIFKVKFLRILAIGDVIGICGCKFLRENLSNLKNEKNIDLIIANGENSAADNGMTAASAQYLLNAGVDVITGGNHTFKKRTIFNYLNNSQKVIRPANYPVGTPGKGFLKFKFKNVNICVINLIGLCYLEPVDCFFETLDNILKEVKDCTVKVIDFHAEATSEKRALGFYADGRISALFGTHTHVQTSDEEILPKGTGYITDVGMSGVIDSVLGVKAEVSIKRMKSKIPLKFEHAANGPCKMECIVFDINEIDGKTISLERIRFTN